MLCLLGGGLGLLVAQWGLALLLAISPVSLADLGPVHLSYPVLAFTAAVSIATAIVCGFAPAFEGARGSVQEALKDGARQIGGSVRHRRIRQAFVVGEIALAVVLLVGAGLMIRSFGTLRRVNPGFDARNVLTARVTVPTRRYPDEAKRIDFFASLVARLAAIPGVESAGEVSYLPLAGSGAATGFTIVGQPAPLPGQGPTTDVSVCDNGYFHALKVPLLRGRIFSEREMREKSNVVVINDALARRYFPNQDPLGKSLVIAMNDPNVPTEIIGVVGSVKFADFATDARPTTYWPHPQLAYSAMTLTRAHRVRSGGVRAAARARGARDGQGPAGGRRPDDGSVGGAHAVAGAVQLDAADDVRGAGAGAGGDRHLRRDVVRGQPAHVRDRHPARARRRSAGHPRHGGRERGQARGRRARRSVSCSRSR